MVVYVDNLHMIRQSLDPSIDRTGTPPPPPLGSSLGKALILHSLMLQESSLGGQNGMVGGGVACGSYVGFIWSVECTFRVLSTHMHILITMAWEF